MINSAQHNKDWRRIAYSSKQCDTEDVAQQAFLFVITDWSGEFNIFDSQHWDELKRKMYNHFVHGADRTLKWALSFDQSTRNDCDEAINPLLLGLSAASSTEPLQHILDDLDQQVQQKKQTQLIEENSFSLALAYVQLFESLKPTLSKYTYLNIAAHLKMSYSWLRECLRRAEKLQKTQASLFDGIESLQVEGLASWRKFKLNKIKHPKFTPVLENQLNLFQQRL